MEPSATAAPEPPGSNASSTRKPSIAEIEQQIEELKIVEKYKRTIRGLRLRSELESYLSLAIIWTVTTLGEIFLIQLFELSIQSTVVKFPWVGTFADYVKVALALATLVVIGVRGYYSARALVRLEQDMTNLG